MHFFWWTLLSLLLLVVVYDVVQRKHAILRNFPIIGHFRYILESIGPELRQYIVTDNDEERPFTRDQRSWVYASAKEQNNYAGFGTDNRIEDIEGYLIIKQSAFPLPEPHKDDPEYDPLHRIPCGKVLGGPRGRKLAFRPESVLAISAMSYGSLSSAAIQALNRGVHIAGGLHNTGEGGISDHHRQGGDLIYQVGTGYFGARDAHGNFSMERLLETVATTDRVRGIEIKLSQGAKPGRGGVLPKEKITPEIQRIRGITDEKDCISPPGHSAFRDVDSMLDFVESIADATGLPVGIKSAVGDLGFWEDLATAMESRQRGVDWIAIDGGEGGTGAAPLVFSDHVALPWRVGFPRVYRTFAERGLHEDVMWLGAGRLGFPQDALLAMALGADMIYMAREAMLAIGCIQAQRCHTGHCPTGVATQNKWLVRGLDPTHKAARLANYLITLRKELMWLARATGEAHPAFVGLDRFEFLRGRYGSTGPMEVFGYQPGWGLPTEQRRREIEAVLAEKPHG